MGGDGAGLRAVRPAVTWDETPEAGAWIAERLAPFGPTVGHAVPLGYEAYIVVAVERFGELIGALGRFTGDQPVHCGMWEGFGFWLDPGEEPRGVSVYWDEDAEPPTETELEEALVEAHAVVRARSPERPDVRPLVLPERAYYLWTGSLDTALAFARVSADPPSVVWPDDRSWFLGAPIYTNEVAVGGSSGLAASLLAEAALGARVVQVDDVLDGDD